LIKKIIIIFIFLTILFAAGSSYYIFKSMKPLESTAIKSKINFTVQEGESLYSVLDRLENNGLIRDPWIYKIYNKAVNQLIVKKGFYSLSPADSGLEILSILEEGRQELLRITIPEGMRSSQIAQLLEEKGITSSESFIAAVNDSEMMKKLKIPADSADGYLFPDTYYFQKDFPAHQILEHMVETYYRNLESIFPFYKDLSDEKLQEKLILASIIEKEYRVAEEAALIASVFNNRMKIGMPLQSCATVIYVITEEQGKEHPDRVLFRDLEIQSDFNTYINNNLPPAPISNPGRTALSASFNPTQSDYLFFVVKDPAAGTHSFTSNLSDHNTARQSYIQGFRSK
jgi:peptidoglycan lytic transglycosylase G